MLKKLFAIGLLSAACSWAADWSETRVEGFYGSGYGDPFNGTGGSLHGEKQLEVISITHASSNTYGGNFLFFDVDHEEDGSVSTYGEWSPKVMWGSLTGSPLNLGILKDIGVTGTLEFAPKDINRLIGLNIALNIPGAIFFDVMPLIRDNPSLSGVTYQITTAWLFPINIGPVSASFDGFLDYTLDEGGGDGNGSFFSKSYFHAQPALFIDLGRYLGDDKAGMLQVGIEYRYWKNKFGIEGLDESIPQFGIRSVF